MERIALRSLLVFVLVALAAISPTAAVGNPIAPVFEWENGSNSSHVSADGVGGPVLADDFIPRKSGSVLQVGWWGSAPLSGLIDNNDTFVITFYRDVLGLPDPSGGISQHFVVAPASQWDFDDFEAGVFEYFAWLPRDVELSAGTTYWFSVANVDCSVRADTGCASGWTWANAGAPGPTSGSQEHAAVVSTGIGPDGTPYSGPWDPIPNQNFAFRIFATPEPGTLLVLGIGVVALALAALKRRTWRNQRA